MKLTFEPITPDRWADFTERARRSSTRPIMRRDL
jgi:hypothetical protein